MRERHGNLPDLGAGTTRDSLFLSRAKRHEKNNETNLIAYYEDRLSAIEPSILVRILHRASEPVLTTVLSSDASAQLNGANRRFIFTFRKAMLLDLPRRALGSPHLQESSCSRTPCSATSLNYRAASFQVPRVGKRQGQPANGRRDSKLPITGSSSKLSSLSSAVLFVQGTPVMELYDPVYEPYIPKPSLGLPFR
ncbi:hypothetical protein LIA77_06162 [Sarocladium implicatum]|nr:hypothetical protein LIA77_06162 [Sarocladium implicatum]